jgi:hypothetical protein
VLALQRKSLTGIVCAAALFALALPAGAATSLEPLDNSLRATIADPTSSLVPETQPYKPLFPIEDEDLASFISHATTNVVSATSETSVWVKMLLGIAGLGFLLHRQVWWRKAAYIAFNQRKSVQRQS